MDQSPLCGKGQETLIFDRLKEGETLAPLVLFAVAECRRIEVTVDEKENPLNEHGREGSHRLPRAAGNGAMGGQSRAMVLTILPVTAVLLSSRPP